MNVFLLVVSGVTTLVGGGGLVGGYVLFRQSKRDDGKTDADVTGLVRQIAKDQLLDMQQALATEQSARLDLDSRFRALEQRFRSMEDQLADATLLLRYAVSYISELQVHIAQYIKEGSPPPMEMPRQLRAYINRESSG